MTQKKLFELLAIERDLSKGAQDAIQEAMNLFSNPEETLLGFEVDAVRVREDLPEIQGENKPLPTTVNKVVKNFAKKIGQFIDATGNKENANTTAFADVMLDGEIFLAKWSATALLNLEARLDELLKVYNAIPTLSFSHEWTFDEGKGCYVSDKRKQIRTQKITDVVVKFPATKEHPAQTEMVTIDRPAYTLEKVMYSGAVPLTQKREMLERIEKLKQAVTQARQRANTVEVNERNISDMIFAYIHAE